MNACCEHQQGCGVYRYSYSPSFARHPLTRWPSLTFWDVTEDRYEDAVQPGEIVWITQFKATIAGTVVVTDYLSERAECEGGIHRGCWIRHIVHYIEGEPSPVRWDVDGTTRHP
jgi:hypothetical protein